MPGRDRNCEGKIEQIKRTESEQKCVQVWGRMFRVDLCNVTGEQEVWMENKGVTH